MGARYDSKGSLPPLHVEVLTASAEFEALAEEWAGLLARSTCDPLFNSWPWQFAWWQTWSGRLSLETSIVCVRETNTGDAGKNGRLVGLLPLCFSPLDRCFAIPGALPRSPTFRSELLDVIVDADNEQRVLDALTRLLRRLLGRAPLFAGDVRKDALLRSLLPVAGGRSLLAGSLTKAPEAVFMVDCSGNFADYLAKLGRNTRLKLFNRRSYLKQHWPQLKLSETSLAGDTGSRAWTERRAQFDKFHQQRWDKPFLGDEGFAFQSHFIGLCNEWNRLCDQDGATAGSQLRPVLSVLECDDRVVSLLYDVLAGHTRYNLQMGFDDAFDSKVSLGTLHLGHAVEATFAGQQRWYNFLAGSGRDSAGSYKTRLATDQTIIASMLSAHGLDLVKLMTIDLGRELKAWVTEAFS